MFKKKSSTQSRPRPPNTNYILEDLLIARNNDIVFELMKQNLVFEKDNNFVIKDANEPLKEQINKGTASSTRHSQDIYENVKSFVEENASLQDMIKLLQKQNETLQTSDLELKRITEDIRKQALDALK